MFTVLTILCYYHCVIGRRSPHVLMNYLLSHSFFVLELLLAETTLSLGPFLAAFRRRTVILQATKIRRCVVPRAACRPLRWSDRWRMQQCCDSYSKPQHWQVLCRLCCPMAHCWLQEHHPVANLRHRVLCYSAGVLQRCFWRTDKWRVHYGTSNPPTA